MGLLHDTPRSNPPPYRLARARGKRRSSSRRQQLETLEARTLLSTTLLVTAPTTPADATHFPTLQAALAAAVAGDTVILQSGFAAGTFVTTSLTAPVAAGTNTIRTRAAPDVGEIVTIGTTTSADPAERALVVAVSADDAGDFLVTLADPLQYGHISSPVDATNSSSIGKTLGVNKAITLTAEAGVVLPFNLDVWKGTSGATLSNLNLTTGTATSVFVDADGNTLSHVWAANQIVLTNAHNNTLIAVTAGNRLTVDTGSSGNVISGSTLKDVALRVGSNHNTFLGNSIGSLTASGGVSGNGYDVFQGNAFTGAVKIRGNLNGPTNDGLADNTFVQSTADGLSLTRADGTVLTGNTITLGKSSARGVVVFDSAGVVIVANQISTGGTAPPSMPTSIWPIPRPWTSATTRCAPAAAGDFASASMRPRPPSRPGFKVMTSGRTPSAFMFTAMASPEA